MPTQVQDFGDVFRVVYDPCSRCGRSLTGHEHYRGSVMGRWIYWPLCAGRVVSPPSRRSMGFDWR